MTSAVDYQVYAYRVMPLESAIIIPVPAAEPAVQASRLLYDPVATRGVPAHITLLYPFAPPSRISRESEALREVFSTVAAFNFSLTEVRRFPTAAYLHPEPVSTFTQLIEILTKRWPEFPPYGGTFAKVIPHLTVADRADVEVLDRVQQQIQPSLPILARATEVWILCSDEKNMWSRTEAFPFRDDQ